MPSDSTPPRRRGVAGRTAQDYIDETPLWADATPVDHAPITQMQWLIWGLAAAGKFFEGMVVFTTGVALPLMGKEFGLGATEQGVIAASSLFGILIGASALGGLADRYGRKQMFIAEMALFCIFTTALALSSSYAVAVAALLGIGLALGCDYPTARVGRIRLQILGFIGCAVGLLLAALSLHVGAMLSGVLLFAGFMVFSFMTNIGPNAMTYLIAGEVFPISIRGAGAGFAASFAKIGAVLTAFLFPILLKDIGTDLLLLILVGTSLVGALVTWRYAIETKGINLEDIDEKERAANVASGAP